MRENSVLLQSMNVVLLVAAVLAITAKSLTVTLALVVLVILLNMIQLLAARPQDYPTKKVLSYSDSSAHKFILSNFPPDVDPRLVDLENKEADIDNTYIDYILFVIGDIAFYDKTNNIVHSFPKPVRLTFNFTEDQYNEFLNHSALSLAKGIIRSTDEAKFMPIYLYKYPNDNPKAGVWKPFQNYSIDFAKKTITVEFQSWGDQQIGGGTKP
jgi:hypothetical protein